MSELLLELFSEEIPARMQAQAAKDLERLVTGALVEAGLRCEAAKCFGGPRRLTLAATGIPVRQPDSREEKKGPRVGAPEKAIEGFLKSAGLTSLGQCATQSDGKGKFYVAIIERTGRATADVLTEILPEAIAKLPWPKSMRWGKGTFRWVRPLHSILATYDGEVVPVEIAGVRSGNMTFGHRFLSSGPITVRRFEDYEAALRRAYVIVDGAERRETILNEAKQAAFAQGLELIDDAGLADEVMGLTEWPHILMGSIDDAFMDVPAEILQTSMRTHQKYFALRDPRTGKLAAKFVVVSNMLANDGGKAIITGNERVLRARLSDAKFFWDQDRKRTLESRVDDLKNIVFQAKLGTQYRRAQRIAALAKNLARRRRLSDGDILLTERASMLCKADLTTGVVGEFPELQGVMGRYYAIYDNHEPVIAQAIRDHYKPLGPNDELPMAGIPALVALADKLDTLIGFFAKGETPTGSSDPYALRRAALGVIRIVLGMNLRIPLASIVHEHIGEIGEIAFQDIPADDRRSFDEMSASNKTKYLENLVSMNLLGFFADRMKIMLREKGIRHDLIDAVFALGGEDDLVRLVARVEALQVFLRSEDGTNILSGYKRAANILKIEEKKEGRAFIGMLTAALLKEPDEKTLAIALAEAEMKIKPELEAERFGTGMSIMAGLRAPIDAFFDRVKVNDADAALRENRLKLLARIVQTAHQVADFSKIEG